MIAPRFRKGGPLPTAEQLNWIVDALNVLGNIEVSGDVEAAQDSGGFMFAVPLLPEFWIRVTSHIVTNKYAWTLLVHDDGTSFDDGPDDDASGTDPAYEIHGNTAVATPIVAFARRDRASGQILFEADACPDGG